MPAMVIQTKTSHQQQSEHVKAKVCYESAAIVATSMKSIQSSQTVLKGTYICYKLTSVTGEGAKVSINNFSLE